MALLFEMHFSFLFIKFKRNKTKKRELKEPYYSFCFSIGWLPINRKTTTKQNSDNEDKPLLHMATL